MMDVFIFHAGSHVSKKGPCYFVIGLESSIVRTIFTTSLLAIALGN